MAGSATFFDHVSVLSEVRGKALTRARLVTALAEDGDIDKSALLQATLLFEDAGSAMNAWLDATRVQVNVGKAKDAKTVDATLIKRGAEKGEVFLDYADSLILGEQRSISELVKPVSDLVTSLVEAGTKIWADLRSASASKKEHLLGDLESLRWPSFKDVA